MFEVTSMVIFGPYKTGSPQNVSCIFSFEEILPNKIRPYKVYFSQISNLTKVCSILKIVLQVQEVQNLQICILFFCRLRILKTQNPNGENKASYFFSKQKKSKVLKNKISIFHMAKKKFFWHPVQKGVKTLILF